MFDRFDRASLVLLASSAAAVLLQIILAPNVVIFSAMPNFILGFVVVLAIVRPRDSTLFVAFVLALLFDLLGYGPVGALALLLVLATFIIARIFLVIEKENLFMSFLVLVAAVAIIEILYSLVLLVLGLVPGVFEAFVYRAIPGVLLDCVVGMILYPLLLRLFDDTPTRSQGEHLSGLLGRKRKSRIKHDKRSKRFRP